MKNEVLEAIRRRRSVRSYLSRQITDAQLETVLDAGRRAPCAGNPPHITALQNAALIEKINTAAKEAAVHMSMPHLERLGSDPGFVGTYGAPTVIIISDRADSVAPELNCAAAAQNMLLAAEALALGACWVHFPLFCLYGSRADEIRADLKLPQDSKPCACIVLGCKGADSQPGDRVYGEITVIK